MLISCYKSCWKGERRDRSIKRAIREDSISSRSHITFCSRKIVQQTCIHTHLHSTPMDIQAKQNIIFIYLFYLKGTMYSSNITLSPIALMFCSDVAREFELILSCHRHHRICSLNKYRRVDRTCHFEFLPRHWGETSGQGEGWRVRAEIRLR